MNFKTIILVLVINLHFSNSAQATEIDQDIKTAHELYLSSDFKKTEDKYNLLMSIKKGLEDVQKEKPENAVARENLLSLYNQFLEEVYTKQFPQEIMKAAQGQENLETVFPKIKKYQKEKGEIIPTGWSLSEDFKTLVVSQERKLRQPNNKIEYSLGYFGVMHDGKEIPEQFQLIRYPSEVLIDKEKNIGSWSKGIFGTGKKFSAGSEISSNEVKDGLYLVKIRMAGQKEQTNGWVIISPMKAPEAPIVLSPKISQIYKTANPTFKWENMTTANFRNYESRKRMLTVGSIGEKGWEKVWSASQIGPDDSTSIQLSESDKLKNGKYSFISSFQERWFFGDVLMQRQTATSVAFSIKAN
ncbi:MAG: hypothetical protein WA160_10650 [Pseudobdellovibrio sp.]